MLRWYIGCYGGTFVAMVVHLCYGGTFDAEVVHLLLLKKCDGKPVVV